MKTPNPFLSFAARLSAAVALLAGAASLVAQNGVWTNLAGGSWAAAANWDNGVIAGGADNTANFGALDIATDNTVTLDGARTIGNLVFGDTTPGNNWLLGTGTGGPLTLAVASGRPGLDAVNGSNTITAVLRSAANPGGFVKSGAGTLRLGAANLLTNVVNNITAGMLQLANATALGQVTAGVAGSNFVADGATLHVVAGVNHANQRVFLVGAGVGGTNGALRADAGAAANQQGTRLSSALNSAANPAFILTGDATIRVDGNTNHAGFLVGAITNNAAGLNHTLTKTGASELRVDATANIAVSNIVIAEGVFGFNGSGNVVGAQVVTVHPGAVAGGRRNLAFNSAASTLVLNGTLELCYNPTAFGDAAGFDQRVGVLLGNGEVRNTVQTSFTTLRVLSAASNSVFGGTFATPHPTNGPIVLRKGGAGTSLRLTGVSSHRGTNIVEAGSLIIDGAMNPSGGYIVNSGAVLAGAGAIFVPVTVNGTLVAGSPAGTLMTVSNVFGAGDIVVSNASLTANGQLNNSASGFFNQVSLTNSALNLRLQPGGVEASLHTTTLNVDGTSNTIGFTMDNPVMGAFPLIRCWVITGTDGFDGLRLQPPPGISAHLLNNVAIDGTIYVVITSIPSLVWRGTPTGDWTIGGPANWLLGGTPAAYTETGGKGPFVVFDDTAPGTPSVNVAVNVTPAGITVDSSTRNYTFSGNGRIGGAGGILKSGSSTLTFANPNTLSGSVAINGGAVSVGSGGAAGDLGSATVVNNSVLVFNRSDDVTFANIISGAGALEKQGAGKVTLTGIGNVGGAVTVSGGALALGPAGAITVSGDVTGGGAFGVSGPGTVILDSPIVAHSGGIILSNGTLQLNHAFPPAGAIANHGTLAVGASGALANDISGPGGVSVINGAWVTLGGANTYTGPTRVLGGGSLTTDTANYPAGSVLMLGSVTGGADTGSATFLSGNPVLGGLTAGGNSFSGNPVTLAAGSQTLAVNGNLRVGNTGPVGASALLTVTGAGAAVVVNTNGGVIQIGLGVAGSGVNPDNVFADFSGVDHFIANLGPAGAVNLGTLDGNPGPPAGATVVNWLNLASVSNFIAAGTINIGAGGRQLVPELRLGAGANVLNVNTLALGPGGRDGGFLRFLGDTGELKLRGYDGVSRALLNVGVNPATTTGASITNRVDLAGHTADLLLSALVIGNYNNAGVYENTFSFDTGVLDTLATSLSVLRNNNANAAVSGSTLNIGGGTARLGPVSLTSSAAYGTLNISNASVTMANVISPGAGLATLSVANSTLHIALADNGNPAAAPVAVDSLALEGAVGLGVSGTNWVAGQFPLLSYSGAIGGAGFPALTLASLPPGVSAHLSNNVANGSVDMVVTAAPLVVPPINPNPTNIAATVTGSTLSLRWPASHTGWILQAQTNSLLAGLSTNWFDVAGSAGTNAVDVPVNKNDPAVFYRLRLP